MSSTQTLSRGGVLQAGKGRFSSPRTCPKESVPPFSGIYAHEGIHPIHMFSLLPRGSTPLTLPISALRTPEGRGYSKGGRCPVRRFPWMPIRSNPFMSLTHNGNPPDSRLYFRCKVCRLESCPSSDGIGPVSSFLSSSRIRRLES